MRTRFHGTNEFMRATPRDVDLFIRVAIRYVWRSRKPEEWPDMRRRKMGWRPRLHWRAATVILLIMYNVGMGYREMEGYLRSRPRLLKRLKLKKAPSGSNINRVYHQLDDVWLRMLNDRIIAQVIREGGLQDWYGY